MKDKEQTPIEKRVEWISKRVDISEHAELLIIFQIKEAVLEALEIEVPKAFIKGISLEQRSTDKFPREQNAPVKYYEAEVEPKYK